jgi:hypothetical protein
VEDLIEDLESAIEAATGVSSIKAKA